MVEIYKLFSPSFELDTVKTGELSNALEGTSLLP